MQREPATGIRRWLLIAGGCLALFLACLGVVLPMVPATPFVLLAGGCFAAAWPGMHARLSRSRLFGPMLQDGPGGRYLPPRAKAFALGFTWLSIGATVVFVAQALWLRLGLVAIALCVTWFVVRMPSAPREA